MRAVELSLELDGGALSAHGYVGELRVARGSGAAPTVLFVTSDTQRADHLGAAAPELGVRTPALAARGVLFERGLSTTDVTLPSQVALGYARAAGPSNGGWIDPDCACGRCLAFR